MEKIDAIIDAQGLVFRMSADIDKMRTVMELLGSGACLHCSKLDEKEMMHLRYNHPNNANLYSVVVDYLFEMDNNINEVMAKLSDLKDEKRIGENNEDNNDC